MLKILYVIYSLLLTYVVTKQLNIKYITQGNDKTKNNNMLYVRLYFLKLLLAYFSTFPLLVIYSMF